ncbi:hypothetical protein EC973_000788 [Apophysomyces ossiformis]|uniref:F-box domain-containing protein n=1 Tax=Apophysomyces ossiformis TaxID=679940 RepID=A0A8H7BKS0_9FUNG|nr:hypothetical protein EC973_000788 [Apophysomyces ossiformis]
MPLSSPDLLKVIELAFDYLSKEDQLILLCICKEWHSKLEHRYYREVIVHQEELFFQCFLPRLRETAETSSPLGHSIKELRLQMCTTLKVNIYEELNSLCPNLETLDLNTDGFTTTALASWCDGCSNLTSLTFDFYRKGCNPLDVLSHAPRLEYLKIDFELPEDLHIFAFSDSVHKFCPRLKTLDMVFHGAESTETCVAIEEDYFRNVEPASSLTRLDLMVELHCYDYRDVILYCAYKYPHLRVLAITSWKFKKSPFIQRRLDVFELFAKRCPELVSLDWFARCAPDVQFFNALADAGTKLTKMIFGDSIDSELPPLRQFPFYQPLLFSHLRHNITEFSVWHNNYYNIMTANELVSDLAWLPNLLRLTIRSNVDPEPPEYTKIDYDIDHLLDCCPHLTELIMLETRIVLSRRSLQAPVKEHPLRRLQMKEAHIAKGVLPRLSRRCRQLNSLSLSLCAIEAEGREIRIEMPYTSLRQLNMNHTLLSLSDTGTIIKFLACTRVEDPIQYDCNEQWVEAKPVWYYMVESRLLRREEKVTGRAHQLADNEARLADVLAKALRIGEFRLHEQLQLLKRDGRILSTMNLGADDFSCGYIHLICASVKSLCFNGALIG